MNSIHLHRVMVCGIQCFLFVAGIFLAAQRPVAAAEFIDLGGMSGVSNWTEARAVSADGSTVTGIAAIDGNPAAFRWTDAEGLVILPSLSLPDTVDSFSESWDISADGGGIVGMIYSTTTYGYQMNAVHWFAGGGVESFPADGDAHASAIAGDGLTVAGTVYSPGGGSYAALFDAGGSTSFGLNSSDGYQYPTVAGLTGDGGKALLNAHNSFNVWISYLYDFNSDTYEFLGSPDADIETRGEAISANGLYVVGARQTTLYGQHIAFLWSGGEFQDIGSFGSYATAFAVADDGQTVVGQSSNAAFIWTPQQGIRYLESVLIQDYNVNLNGYILNSAVDISADGRTIVGTGTAPSGETHAWLVRLDAGGSGDPDDFDGDGMPNQWELDNGLDPYFDDSADDPDYDMLNNLGEFQNGTQPFNPDTDGDYLFDGEEVANGTNPLSSDSDGDTLPDGWETYNGLNPNDPNDAASDNDFDGLTALDEFNYGTNPQLYDTDGDGLDDGTEVGSGLNPDHPDTDNDGIADADEYDLGLNPLARDSDGDGIIDGFEFARIVRASVPADGHRTSGTYDTSGAALSADGRYMAFVSESGELVAGDNNGVHDVFVHDLVTGHTELISVASDGGAANDWSGRIVNAIGLDISADGRYVVFMSQAGNLVDTPVNGTQIYLRDRQTGTTELVSVNSQGEPATYGNFYPSISADGRYVAFESSASNLVENDTNNKDDIFVRDRQTGQTIRVSVASDGSEGNNYSDRPVISANGRFVAFESRADNLVPNDTNGINSTYYDGKDVFVHDLQTGETSRVSVSSEGVEANDRSEAADISADGRFVVFQSYADNLVASDYHGNGPDALLHDRQTGITSLVSLNRDGNGPGNKGSWGPVISQDGRYVAFVSMASDLIPVDNEGHADVFLRALQSGITKRLSVNSEGIAGNYDSGRYGIAFSNDNRFIAFQSEAGNLVPGDAYSGSDVFVTLTGVTGEAETVIDLAVDGPAALTVNGTSNVTYTVTNNSAAAANNVLLEFDVEPGVSISNAIFIGGQCNFGSEQAICNLSSLPANASAEVQIQVSAVSSGQFLANVAVLADGVEAQPGNNSMTTVLTTNLPPDIDILSPQNGETFAEQNAVMLSASAYDTEDGSLSAMIEWYSDRDGYLGQGASISSQLSVGTHVLTARVQDSAAVPSEASVSVLVNADQPPSSYCASYGSSTGFEWIQSVSVGGYVNNSGNNDGYRSFAVQPISLSKGGSYNITLTPGFSSGSYNERWRLWIDLNGDGTFGSDELLFSGSSSSSLNGSINIPTSAVSGETGMRVSMRYGSYPNACGSFTYGEVEDYTLILE